MLERQLAIKGTRNKRMGKNPMLRICVRLVPSVRLIFAGTPLQLTINGFARQMRNGCFGSAIQNRESVEVVNISLGVDEAENEFVEAVGRETVFVVELLRYSFCVQAVEAQNLAAGF